MKKKKTKAKPQAKAKSKPKSRAAVLAKAARPRKRAAKRKGATPQMASRRRKGNEIGSDRSLRSSLTEGVGLAPRSDEAALRAGQSGDLQGLSNLDDADSESVGELIEDGQAFEAEIIEGVEDVPDEKPVPRRGRLTTQGEPPEDFDNKDRI